MNAYEKWINFLNSPEVEAIDFGLKAQEANQDEFAVFIPGHGWYVADKFGPTDGPYASQYDAVNASVWEETPCQA